MKKRSRILDEVLIWLNGRFTLTNEEKTWILTILVICWVGLAGRYFYIKNLPVPQQIEEVCNP